MIDVNALLRDGSTDLDADDLTPTGVETGQDLVPVTYFVNIPAAPTGTTPTLDVKIQESDDDSTYRDFLAFPQMNAKGTYFVTGKSNAKYRRFAADVGGTTPNFGKVKIGIVPAGRDKNW